jgi:heptosyltransferase-2
MRRPRQNRPEFDQNPMNLQPDQAGFRQNKPSQGVERQRAAGTRGDADSSPILLIPYMWIGDFVRCHTVVRLLKTRWPQREIDVLTTSLCAPLVDYMPGVRRGIVVDLPRRRLALQAQFALAGRLREQQYGTALVMLRTWKSALAPYLAGIPERIGFVGEGRFLLLNDLRRGERQFPRMVDRCGALALPKGASVPSDWPTPHLEVPPSEAENWRQSNGLAANAEVVALAPGAVGASKRWPVSAYAEVARELTSRGIAVWVLGSPNESPLATEIVNRAGPLARDLTSPDLRNAVLALKCATAAISNDSGLVHVAAAIGTPTIGIFGPTSPWHWAPLNPLAGIIETLTEVPCRPCHKPVCRLLHHRCMRDIPPAQVLAATLKSLAQAGRR